jgi:Protein of unknown function (DUF2384)
LRIPDLERSRLELWVRPQTPALTSPPELKAQLEHPSAEIIWARAVEVFGNEGKATNWMQQPRPIFNNRSPQQVAEDGDTAEQREVLESLIAIDYGLFS